MTTSLRPEFRDTLLRLIPEDGSAIGNQNLKEQFFQKVGGAGLSVSEGEFDALRESLIEQGVLLKGKGRGGSVRRASGQQIPAFSLKAQERPSAVEPPKLRAKKTTPHNTNIGPATPILSYRHKDTRRNNPEVGVVTPATDPPTPHTLWQYDPHLDPALQFDSGRSSIEKLIDEALASGDQAAMQAALEELKRLQQPYLNWSGKAERTSFAIDTVSLHVHERMDPMSILAAVRKRLKGERPEPAGKGGASSPFQLGLFSAPFENLPLREAIDFYHHDKGWANRLVAGDSLLVMNSLLQKEGMAGQVHMIFLDPPYGIKYGSNFQPFVGKRDVKDRKDEDLTQEPEMIKAFRDTWELGIHSYLTYLRDRLLLAKDLLSESGSVFVQISDENLHHVRELMDEVFGAENYCSTIQVQKTGSQEGTLLGATVDFLVWYAKDKESLKYRQLYLPRNQGDKSFTRYDFIELPEGSSRRLTRDELFGQAGIPVGKAYQYTSLISDGQSSTDQLFEFRNREFRPKATSHWKTSVPGLQRIGKVRRIEDANTTVRYKRYLNDFPVVPVDDRWESMQIGKELMYVVQTAERVIERCLLMTTDPGDLVLDPTCGSGTTAFVAEKWGRRWITCDTSRVAVTLAKQRLVTASYDYFALKYPHEGLKGGFIYKTVPHVTLKSIANNPEIDEIYERMHPAIEQALADLNAAVGQIPPGPPLPKGGEKRDGDSSQWPKGGEKQDSDSPPLKKGGVGGFMEWEVPFDFPTDWPEPARAPFAAFHKTRQAMQKQMDASIVAHADQETLYDQPQPDKKRLRITGPFTVEAVPFPTVLSLDEAKPAHEADVAIARSGESARQHQWRDELLKTGIRGKGGQMLRFAELEALPTTRYLHVSGHLDSGERVVVSFGPEHAALEQRQVELALREAGELFPLPKMIVYCAFAFDPEAAKDIDNLKGITALKAQMNIDLLTEDLKKARSSNQSFWLMGQPDVDVRKGKDGRYQVEVNGFDYFDTTKGELISGGKGKIAMWLLDTDYDERSLFPRQVFFPMAGKGEGWQKLKKNIRAELNDDLLEQFHGTVSLPFEPGDNRKVAVKIVDDRGIESLKIIPLED